MASIGFNGIEPDQQAKLRHDRAKNLVPERICTVVER
jgi:hypothetical protein